MCFYQAMRWLFGSGENAEASNLSNEERETQSPYGLNRWFSVAMTGLMVVFVLATAANVDMTVAANNIISLSKTAQPVHEHGGGEHAHSELQSDNISEEQIVDLLNESIALDTVVPDEIDIPDSEWKYVKMRVTAYCPCRICCGKHSNGITANMHRIRRGDRFVAADRKFGFGTEMVIPGYNYSGSVKVMDRGGAIKGNKLDVFFNSHRQAKKWGVQYLNVKVKKSS